MADKYYRLVCFLVNITPRPLRELFLKYMRTDPKLSTCSTIDACLKLMKHQLYLLKKKKVIRQAQWELLFPSAPGKVVDKTSWDITLVNILIEEFYGNKLQQVEENAISKIRGIRNRLQHFAETSIDDADFDNMWTNLECATIDLAKQIQPPSYVNDIQGNINETKINNLPNLGDSLRYLYETIIIQMKSDTDDMKEIMEELAEKSNESRNILLNTTEKRVGPTGEKVKRIKTVDHILNRLADNFTTSMKEDLPSNFDSPPEVDDIKTKLRDGHHVVVTGSRGSRYLEAALASLKSMDYNHNRCVEMKNACDWRHIDPDEVDLVLCREPFGDFMFDTDKTKSMADIFSSMLHTSKISEKYKNIDIMIVSEKEILQQVLKFREHDLLQEVVEVYQPTTESDPADLTGTCDNSEMDFDQATRNQLELTAVFVERYRDDKLHPSSVVNEARATFNREKVIVITGPRKCGKTTLAVTLASRYQKNQFLVLNKPDDMKLIRLGSICTVLVEDFAGKSSYNGTFAEAWLREFELLFSAVCSRKLNVIITCEKRTLITCNEEHGPHPILKNTIVLEHVMISRTVKQESSSTDVQDTESAIRTVQSCSSNIETPNTSTYNRVKKIQTHKINIPEDVNIVHMKEAFCQHPDGSFLRLADISVDDNVTPENVTIYRTTEWCQHPNGSFLFLARMQSVDDNIDGACIDGSMYIFSIPKIVIIHISSDFEYQCCYNTDLDELSYTTNNICCTDTGGVVISVSNQINWYRLSSGSLQFIKSTKFNMGFSCSSISFFKNKIYCFSDGMSIILDTNLNIKKTVELMTLFVDKILTCSFKKYISISYFGYVDNCIICEDSKLKQLKYLRKKGFEPKCICADTEDSVFVFGKHAVDFKILQVNTDLTVLSEIFVNKKEMDLIDLWDVDKMVFDKDNSRLVISSVGYNGGMFHTIYLE